MPITIPTVQGTNSPADSRLVVIKEVGGKREFRALLSGEVSESLQYAWTSFMEGTSDVMTKFLHAARKTLDAMGLKWLSDKLPGSLGKNPSLTIMLGGFPDHLDLTVTCRLWTYSDPYADVYEPLTTLKEMATPDVGKVGGFDPKYVSVRVGNFLRVPQAVIVNISSTHSQVIVNKVPSWVDVSIQLRSSTIATLSQIRKMHVQVRTGSR